LKAASAHKGAKAQAVEPGCGAPPAGPGLYWVRCAHAGRLLAHCDGQAPFLRISLLDPWQGKCIPNITAKSIEALTWLGKIPEPEEAR
jgi:phage FluMu protein Com